MRPARRRSARALGMVMALALASCGPEPVAVVTGLEVVVAEGDGQFGTAGQTLATPLRAVVRTEATQVAQEGVSVLWVVEAGGATIVTATTTTSDETGGVEARIRLGTVAPAEVTVRATVVEQSSASVTFTLNAVETPVLSGMTPSSAAAGDTVSLVGANFSPQADQNVVLFSGVRGRVVSGSGSQLMVEVPSCLPARAVSVTVQLGSVASGAQTLTLTEGGPVTSLAVLEPLDVSDDEGYECFALEGGADLEYLVIAYSASTVGAAMHPFQLTALSSASPAPVPPALAASLAIEPARPSATVASLWEEQIRTLEGAMIERERSGLRPPRAPSTAPSGPAEVPTVGQTRTFSVWAGGGYEEISAVARYVGTEGAIFVDVDAPTGGFTAEDLEGLAGHFDAVIQPEVTSAFGSTSDLDANERVIILFTPVVNALTPRGASGFIGGFFFGNDLIPANNGSNGGEVFYALVPDPTGIHSDPRTKADVIDVVPAVLAHEFQHMVHFNERFLKLDGGQDALWLSEALAQMAEEIVARRYEADGQGQLAAIFRGGARARASRYLAGPEDVSLIVSSGQGSLGERGGGFLHLLYLTDQVGTDLLGRLTQTTRTGVANVTYEIGRGWPDILADWWAATYLDGPDPESGPLVYPEVDLRGYMGGVFPLVPVPIGPGSTTDVGLLWSSSAQYYILRPAASGSSTIRLGGEAGGPSSAQASLRLRIVRLP